MHWIGWLLLAWIAVALTACLGWLYRLAAIPGKDACCGKCVHFKRVGNQPFGVCRRYPPSVDTRRTDNSIVPGFPEVHCAAVCGEFRER